MKSFRKQGTWDSKDACRFVLGLVSTLLVPCSVFVVLSAVTPSMIEYKLEASSPSDGFEELSECCNTLVGDARLYVYDFWVIRDSFHTTSNRMLASNRSRQVQSQMNLMMFPYACKSIESASTWEKLKIICSRHSTYTEPVGWSQIVINRQAEAALLEFPYCTEYIFRKLVWLALYRIWLETDFMSNNSLHVAERGHAFSDMSTFIWVNAKSLIVSSIHIIFSNTSYLKNGSLTLHAALDNNSLLQSQRIE